MSKETGDRRQNRPSAGVSSFSRPASTQTGVMVLKMAKPHGDLLTPDS